jgi:hypothetical protein
MEKFVKLIKLLAISDEPALIGLQKTTLESVTPDQLERLMAELQDRLKGMIHDVRLSKEVPFLEIFLGHCYNLQMSRSEALEHIHQATEKFKFINQEYNAALAHWYLGLLYEAADKPDLSCAELRESAKLLSQIEKDAATRGNYPLRDKIRGLFLTIKTEFDCASQAPFGKADPKPHGENKTVTASVENGSGLPRRESRYYLKPLMMPVYHSVVHARVGSGIEWVDPPEAERVDISQLMIEGRSYQLESVIQGVQKVNLASGKEYGLVRVDGKSMNAFRTPIDHGDYVLFYRSSDIESSVNKVIIVSRPLEKGYSYLVKQLKRRRPQPGQYVEYELVSHTTESGPEYDSVQLEQQDGIFGEVIAVAKPTDNQSSESEQAEVVANQVETAERIVFSGSEIWRMTPQFLLSTLTPYLAALADIQSVINEAQKKTDQEIYISLIKQSSPISVSLDGATEAVQVVREMVIPWRRKHAEKMACLAEQEKQIEIEKGKAAVLVSHMDAAKAREEKKHLELENAKLQLELERAKIQHARDLLDVFAPNLSEYERITLLIKLIPPLSEVISSKLELTPTHQS